MAFSLCVLLYGDYPQLASRVLRTLLELPDWSYIQDVRLGLNAVSAATEGVVAEFCGQRRASVPVRLWRPERNVGKPPLMRRMFYDVPLACRVMWFDDDSYLGPTSDRDWWKAVRRASETTAVLGAIHTIRQRGRQWQGIQQQPWYRGKPVSSRTRFRFATGGWWVADSEFLRRHDYPFRACRHDGDDSILGELCRQQDAVLQAFPRLQCGCESCRKRPWNPLAGVYINHEGRQGRRGLGLEPGKDVYPWEHYDPAVPEQYGHHDFACEIETC